MEELLRIIKKIVLVPLSYVYGAVTFTRNKLFDWKILKSVSFNIPVISIGNIAVGGTGKTPHTEYVISLLSDKYNTAVLSRGYKRKTSGFILAFPNCTPSDIGDEPYQIYQKFGSKIKVAVCGNRVKGICELQRIDPSINLIILDDAFQHRYVNPKVSIALSEFNKPFFEDRLLPVGRLRESSNSIRERADIVVMTKCPDDIKPIKYRIIKKHLNLFPYQHLFFSRYRYDNPVPVFPEESTYIPMLSILTKQDIVLAITGIANPVPLVKYLKKYDATVKIMQFSDHHNFSRTDMKNIQEAYKSLKGRYKIMITTEKDAVRMATNPYFPYELKQHIFYQPITVEFINNENEDFDSELIKMIENKNK